MQSFNVDTQKQNGPRLARFLELCVQDSQNADWMQPMLDACLCILCENDATALLVASTIVDLYFQVVIKAHDESGRTPFWHALERIHDSINGFIVQLNDDSIAIEEILSEFFHRLNDTPSVISYNTQGMGELIGHFFSIATPNVHTKLLTELRVFCKKHLHEHGANLLQICANQSTIVDELTYIICGENGVRIQRLALSFAIDMQR